MIYNTAMSRGLTAGLDYTSYVSIITQKCTFCGKAPRQKTKGPRVAHNEMCWDKTAKNVTGDDCYSICTRCKVKLGKDKPAEHLEYIMNCSIYMQTYLPTK